LHLRAGYIPSSLHAGLRVQLADSKQRGLVPAIKFSGGPLNDEIITESAVVSQFLVDSYPSHLLPAVGDASSALVRARINFFVDTWFSKIGSYWIQIAQKETDEEKEALVKEFVSTVGKEIEPLLKDAAPFFGGSSKLTFAEVRRPRLTYLH
jgi:glutathione S-transferase